MELTVLGTGAADGWPSPFCTCASCQGMRTRGEIRGQTSALIDAVILLDCGPETPRAAERAGCNLANVHTILLTHAHPDHVGPAALLWRSWANRPETLEVIGPSSAVEVCRHWVGPDDPVTFTVVDANESLQRHGYVIRTLAANHSVSAHGIDRAAVGAVLYDVTSPDGARILYATDTGPLAAQTIGRIADTVEHKPFDVVLLEETFGDRVPGVDLGDNHHDLDTFGRTVATLRTRKAIDEASDVIAIHLGHHNPATPILNSRLAAWGARTVPDGTHLTIDPSNTSTAPHAVHPHRTFVVGGARSGKSMYAERLLAAHPRVTYVATSQKSSSDEEWARRVAAHEQRRPTHWHTVETTDLEGLLDGARDGDALLIDCLTLWLAAVCDGLGHWSEDAGQTSRTQIGGRIESLVAALRRTHAQVVLVSNEVGSGIVPTTPSGREFRDLLGHLNAAVSAQCEGAVLLVAGHAVPLTAQDQEPNT